jgi:beta-glucosidase-like glycosyl hydrolase
MLRKLAILILLPVSLMAASWAEKTVAAMSDEQLAMQLLIVGANGSYADESVVQFVQDYQVGGLIFMRGYEEAQCELVERCQQEVDVPLLVSQDQEWGPAMRLFDGVEFPRALTLAAVRDPQELVAAGQLMGRLAKSAGVRWIYQPVTDLMVDPLLSIVGMRALSDNANWVAERSAALIAGIQSEGVMACAKHFPGHGAANADSHDTLPQVPNVATACEGALEPFAAAIAAGVDTVMVGHLMAPYWDSNLPTSLSPTIMQGLLRQQLGFEGLIVTDSLTMKAISNQWSLAQASAQALASGADMVMMCASTPPENQQIRPEVDEVVQAICSRLTRDQLEERALRVLEAKQRLNLHRDTALGTVPDPTATQELIQRLYNKAVTLVHNDGLVPLPMDDWSDWSFMQIRGPPQVVFFQELGVKKVTVRGSNEKFVLAIFPEQDLDPERFGVSPKTENLVNNLGPNCIVVWFGPPWGLKYLEPAGTLICAYEATEAAQVAAASLLLGRIGPSGQLPVDVSPSMVRGTGLSYLN